MVLVFWQKMISMHQAYYLKILAQTNRVILAVENELHDDRKLQGWKVPEMGNVEIVMVQSIEDAQELISKTKDFLHIFGGIRGGEIHDFALNTVIKQQKIGVIAESAIQLGYKTFFKKWYYRYLCFKYRKNISFILAMGKIGVDWYKSCCFDPKIIHQFQYFTELPKDHIFINRESSDKIRFTYVGQLIHRKGVDTLIKAFEKVKNKNWHLNIIGSGILEQQLKTEIAHHNLTDNVSFLGNKKNEEIVSFLESHSDYLILPSRFDGWGAVVNESLSVGTPVLVSKNCGASSLIINDELGYVFKLKEKEITALLEKIVENKIVKNQEKIKEIYNREFTNKKVKQLIEFLNKR